MRDLPPSERLCICQDGFRLTRARSLVLVHNVVGDNLVWHMSPKPVSRELHGPLRRFTDYTSMWITSGCGHRVAKSPADSVVLSDMAILRQLTYRLLHRHRHCGPAALTASENLLAFPSARVRHNPRHPASRTPIRVDDGSGAGVFASAEGKRMGINVMKASRRRPTGADNFHFENGKTKTSQPREKKCCILFPFVRTGVFTIP